MITQATTTSASATTAEPPSAATAPPPAVSHAPYGAHATDATHLLASVQSLVVIIVVAVFILTFCVQPFRIPSGSMEPTLMIGDFLLVDKQATGPDNAGWPLPDEKIRRGEVIVFHYPVDPAIHLVKRVIGVPGDHIRLRAGRVYIDGHLITEPYAMYIPTGPDNFRDNFPRLENADPTIDSRWWIRMRALIDNGELIVPSDSYFVLGDNRNDSEDSRYWGFVPRSSIVGSPLMVYFSLRQGLPGNPLTTGPQNRRTGLLDGLVDFARWDRTLRIVR